MREAYLDFTKFFKLQHADKRDFFFFCPAPSSIMLVINFIKKKKFHCVVTMCMYCGQNCSYLFLFISVFLARFVQHSGQLLLFLLCFINKFWLCGHIHWLKRNFVRSWWMSYSF